ncbi:MAG: nuclear transport factor 2 family protein [Pseudomonadota bacterium]
MTNILLAGDHGDTLVELEQLRGRALIERDFDALRALLSDDLIYTHSTGVVQDKRSYMEEVAGPLRFLAIERQRLRVQCFGDLALMSGYMISTFRPPARAMPATVETHVLQVWRHEYGAWTMLAFQSTRLNNTGTLRQVL